MRYLESAFMGRSETNAAALLCFISLTLDQFSADAERGQRKATKMTQKGHFFPMRTISPWNNLPGEALDPLMLTSCKTGLNQLA